MSMEESWLHFCAGKTNFATSNLDFIHSLFQELENSGVELPIGTYAMVYDIVEDIREDYIFASDMWNILISGGE
jgi:membrane-anchored protein YejM (alkaline phosphatase superfamily)